MLLQIPVCYCHRGGEFQVIHQDQSRTFKTSHRNPDTFLLTVFSSDCQLIRQPVIHGSLVELVFHLRLKTRPPAPQQDDDPLYRIWQNPVPALHEEALARFTRRQAALASLFSVWKETGQCKIEVFAIPLDHQYSKSTLSFRGLKGIDRLLVDQIRSMMDSFVELHLAVVHKYIGYDDDDWNAFGRLRTYSFTGKKKIANLTERDWTEFLASNFVDRNDRRLKLPPLPINIPDELIGDEGQVFHLDRQLDPDRFEGGQFDGLVFHRPALIMWPRKKSLSVALCFGLDSALDVVEQGHFPGSPCQPQEPLDIQVRLLLAYTSKYPLNSWFVHTLPWTCRDQRCFAAQPASLAVASQRVTRLLDICLRWNLRSAGLELLEILGTSSGDVWQDQWYFCSLCSASCKPKSGAVFVGGVHSNSVAVSLAKLINMLGWSTDVKALVARLLQHADQLGPLCHLALSLHRLENHVAAASVFTQTCKMLMSQDVDFFEILKAIPSYIETARVIDPECLDGFFLFLRDLGEEYTPHLVASFQSAEPKLLKDLPEGFQELYISLCSRLEANVDNPMPPWTWYYQSSSTMDGLHLAASHLMSAVLWLQDAELLRSFLDRITQPTPPGKRSIIPALLATHSSWATPSGGPLAQSTVAELVSIRIRQLSRYHKSPSKTRWEQPNAVLDGFPQVEAFLRSNEKAWTFDGFANQEEVNDLVARLTRHAEPNSGYHVEIVETGGPDGNAFVKVAKTDAIFQSMRKELKALKVEAKGMLNQDKEAGPSASPKTIVVRSAATVAVQPWQSDLEALKDETYGLLNKEPVAGPSGPAKTTVVRSCGTLAVRKRKFQTDETGLPIMKRSKRIMALEKK